MTNTWFHSTNRALELPPKFCRISLPRECPFKTTKIWKILIPRDFLKLPTSSRFYYRERNSRDTKISKNLITRLSRRNAERTKLQWARGTHRITDAFLRKDSEKYFIILLIAVISILTNQNISVVLSIYQKIPPPPLIKYKGLMTCPDLSLWCRFISGGRCICLFSIYKNERF